MHTLPSVPTIRRLLSACMTSTGPDKILLDAVKAKVEGDDRNHDKYATLGFDAMSLTEALRYHEHVDRIVGYEDVGSFGRTIKVANQGLIAVLRSIGGNWKLPIAYYLIRDAPSQERFSAIINECLRAAESVGVVVKVLTCDQEKTQWAALCSMGVSVNNPLILNPSTRESIFVVPDPPHCLKNTRNALMKNDILFAKGKFARWEDVERLWYLENRGQLRLAPKLTAAHLELPPGANMKVKLAAQILSFTCAAAIRAYVRLGEMSEQALNTAEFMERANLAFDCCNGTSPNAPEQKAAITTKNMLAKVSVMRASAEWIGQWRFFSRKTKTENKRHSFNVGWQVALRAMTMASPLLLKVGLPFVPLRRLGQDHIENIFSLVRGRNG